MTDEEKEVSGEANDAVTCQEQKQFTTVSLELPRHKLKQPWKYWSLIGGAGPWRERLRPICAFETIEDFWALHRNLKPPSQLQPAGDYFVFKDDIQPMWEVPQNCNGGRWIINIEKKRSGDVIDVIWLEVLMALIGEQFGDDMDLVCGAICSVRGKGCSFSKVCLWTADCNALEGNIRIGLILKQKLLGAVVPIGLKTPLFSCMRYEDHEENQKKTGSTSKIFFTLAKAIGQCATSLDALEFVEDSEMYAEQIPCLDILKPGPSEPIRLLLCQAVKDINISYKCDATGRTRPLRCFFHYDQVLKKNRTFNWLARLGIVHNFYEATFYYQTARLLNCVDFCMWGGRPLWLFSRETFRQISIPLLDVSTSCGFSRFASTKQVDFLYGDEKFSATAKVGDTLLEVVLSNHLPFDGFGACGGMRACCTCHIILSSEHYERVDRINPAGQEEVDLLDIAPQLCKYSRLACQIQIDADDSEKIVVTVPVLRGEHPVRIQRGGDGRIYRVPPE